MSWFIDTSVVYKGADGNQHWKDVYGPADEVPRSGIYRCLGCKKEVTCNRGDKFPPQNHHQHSPQQGAIKWKLNVLTNTEGK